MKSLKKISFLFLFWVWMTPLHGQAPADSLRQVLVALQSRTDLPADTLRIVTLKALVEAEKLNYPDRAFTYAQQTLDIANRLGQRYPRGLADGFFCMGELYWQQSDYEKSLNFFFKALKINELMGDAVGQAVCMGKIALIYVNQKNFAEALELQFKALKISEKDKNLPQQGQLLNQIGINYYNQQQYEQALMYYKKAIALNQYLKDATLKATLLNNIGLVFQKQGKYAEALPYYKEALQWNLENNKKYGLLWNHNGLGEIYLQLKNYDSARYHLEQSLQIARPLNRRTIIRDNYRLQSLLCEAQGDYRQALLFQKMFKEMNDSIFDSERSKQIARMQAQYETTQEKQENELLKRKNELHEQTSQKHTAVTLAVSVALISAIFMAYRQRRINALLKNKNDEINYKNLAIAEQNELLSEQRSELVTRNEELHRTQHELLVQRDTISLQNEQIHQALYQIRSSINAAQKIQAAMLPFENRMKKALSDYFVIYQPKDIVSGDFYWLYQSEDQVMIAAVDCTGHGVAGAFMSMIGYTLLDKIVAVNKIRHPAQILEQLDTDIQEALKQNEHNDHSEGMDIGICLIEKTGSGDFRVEYAGANRPLYYFSNESREIGELKGTRRSIGKLNRKARVFERQSLVLAPGSMLYLSSDGFTDQNNSSRERFGTARFRELLGTIAEKTLVQQKHLLEETLLHYQEQEVQRDDILVMGIRL